MGNGCGEAVAAVGCVIAVAGGVAGLGSYFSHEVGLAAR